MKKKLFMILFAVMLLLANSSIILANEVTETQTLANLTGTTTATTTVNLSVPSEFSVTTPKTMDLNSSTKSGEYEVTVNGGIAGYEYVSVVPEASFTLSQSGREDITATVTQEKTKWYSVDMGTSTTGHVSIEGNVPAGDWSGPFVFYIDLIEELPGLYSSDGTMIASWDELGIDAESDYIVEHYLNQYMATNTTLLRQKYPSETTARGLKLVLPGTIERIGNGALYNMPYLSEVVISEGTKEIGKQAFASCNALTKVVFPSTLKIIDSWAFEHSYGLANQNLNIPASVEYIGESAFPNYPSSGALVLGNVVYRTSSDITEYTVPDNIVAISKYAFQTRDLTTFNINSNIKWIDRFALSGTPWLEAQQAASDNGMVIANNILIDAQTSTGEVVIPEGVTTIAGGAFQNNADITNITWPSTLTTISREAFSASKVPTVVLPDTVNYVAPSAFYSSEVTSVTWSSAATTIENEMFLNSKLASFIIPNTVTKIGSAAFYGTQITEIVIPEGIEKINYATFYRCSKLATANLPSTLKVIDAEAFMYCTTLASVTYAGTTYTSIAELTAALEANGVSVGSNAFANTAMGA